MNSSSFSPNPTGFNTVVFDCDSTLSAIEGIESLATAHRAEIVALTEAAMQGTVPLEQVYGRRLQLVQPTRPQVDDVGRQYIANIVEDAAAVVRELLAAKIDVRIVSGGLLPAVLHLSRHLGIADNKVAAVAVSFDDAGRYAGYDSDSPLARSGGKLELLRSWLPGLTRPIMMVGDGSTDLETVPVVDLFVAYAGVIARDVVIRQADIVIHTRSLAPIFALATNGRNVTGKSADELRAKGAQTLIEMEK